MRISQCMIVKNEEANIEKALSWGKDIVWEQIVVDTGSTDRTVELAEAMGAKIYHFEWIDDFAAAKNFAISKAKGDWIALLDADEYLVEGDEKKLKKLIKDIGKRDIEAISTAWVQLKENDEVGAVATQIRIFKNKPDIRYKRRIHEQLITLSGRALKTVDATQEISILHTGNRGEAFVEKRANWRNRKLIIKELEDHPEDHEMIGYLGDEYYTSGETKEARETYQRAIAAMPSALDEFDMRSAITFLYLLQIMQDEKAPEEEFEAVYQKAVTLLPKDADFDYMMGRHLAANGEYLRGGKHLEKAVEKLERYGSFNRSMRFQANLQESYEIMALCFLFAGELQKAITYSVAVLKANPYTMRALVTLLRALHGNDSIPSVQPEEAFGFLKKLYNFNSVKDKIILLRAAGQTDWPQLVDMIGKDFTVQELEQAVGILKKDGDGNS